MIKKLLKTTVVTLTILLGILPNGWLGSKIQAATSVTSDTEFASAIGSANFDIVIDADFSITTARTINNSGTIDLNGHTILLSATNSVDSSTISTAGNSNIVITNSDPDNQGVIKRASTTQYYMIRANGSLTIKSEPGAKEAVIDGGAIWDKDSTKTNYSVTLGRVMSGNVTTASSIATERTTNSGVEAIGAMICASSNTGVVYLEDGAILQNNMACNNTGSGSGGAVAVQSGAKLTMTGGMIQDCAIYWNGGGGNGGAVAVGSNAVFEMFGGEIRRNHANYVLSNFSFHGGTGGAVYISEGIFIMQGGTIHHNLAADGGGVQTGLAANSRFHMIDGIITENYATYGGGIQNNSYVTTSDLAMEDAKGNLHYGGILLEGGIIDNNTAIYSGGGVDNDATSANNRNAHVSILGVTISNNKTTTTNDSYGGAGICLRISQSSNNTTTPETNIIKGAVITNNVSGSRGGGILVMSAYANVEVFEDNVITGNQANNGGGVAINAQRANINLKNNIIDNNKATTNGGGLHLAYATAVKLQNQIINANSAGAAGGGVYVGNSSTQTAALTMEDSSISGNKVGNASGTTGNGGGVYLNFGSVTLNNKATITGNTAAVAGGGVYVNRGTFTMNSGSVLYRNIANLNLDLATANSDDIYASGTSTAITLLAATDMVLPASQIATGWFNDYIDAGLSKDRYRNNYREEYPVTSGTLINETIRLTLGEKVCKVTYNDNLSTSGTVPVDANEYKAGDTVEVLDKNDLERTDYTFIGWATSPSGAFVYIPGDTFVITDDLTLYAVWQLDTKYTVTYDGNGNTSGAAPVDSTKYTPGATVTVMNQNDLNKTDNTFIGWATSPSGAVAYTPGDTFVITDDLTLYAVWQLDTKYTVTYDGNGNTSGTVPVDSTKYTPGATVTVMNQSDLEKTDNTFIGWATSPNGAVVYNVGDTFVINDNVTLYAVWQLNGNPTPEVPDTGDGSNIALAMFTIFVGIAIFLAIKKKRYSDR